MDQLLAPDYSSRPAVCMRGSRNAISAFWRQCATRKIRHGTRNFYWAARTRTTCGDQPWNVGECGFRCGGPAEIDQRLASDGSDGDGGNVGQGKIDSRPVRCLGQVNRGRRTGKRCSIDAAVCQGFAKLLRSGIREHGCGRASTTSSSAPAARRESGNDVAGYGRLVPGARVCRRCL